MAGLIVLPHVSKHIDGTASNIFIKEKSKLEINGTFALSGQEKIFETGICSE
jgi:hypothetical protein